MTARRYFRVPADRTGENGMFVGGGWIGFAKASPTGVTVATVPAAGDYSWAMPAWPECDAQGNALGLAEEPQAAAGTPDESGAENGAPDSTGGASETEQ